MKALNSFIIILGALVTILSTNLFWLFSLNLVFLIIYFLFTFSTQSTFIRLFQIWILAFIYIVIPEGFVYAALPFEVNPYVRVASEYICLSNWAVLLSHNLFFLERENKERVVPKVYNVTIGFFIIIMIFYLVFLSINLPHAMLIMTKGRVSDLSGGVPSNPFLVGIANAAGHILPAIIAFYFKRIKSDNMYLSKSLLFVLPIFIILFLGGTRFHLLFSVGGYLLILYSEKKLNIGNALKAAPALMLLILGGKIMVSYRVFGLREGFSGLIAKTFFSNEKSDVGLLSSIEGLIYQSSVMVEYFVNHAYMKGVSSSFIFYFWIPRSIWPEKPQMLGYWLMREAEGTYGFSKGHSFSFGFMGDAYADFGFYGGLMFCLFLGFLLSKLDFFTKDQISMGTNYSLIIAAMSFSYIFFFVRSPLTATFNFFGVLFIFIVIRFTLKGFYKSA